MWNKISVILLLLKIAVAEIAASSKKSNLYVPRIVIMHGKTPALWGHQSSSSANLKQPSSISPQPITRIAWKFTERLKCIVSDYGHFWDTSKAFLWVISGRVFTFAEDEFRPPRFVDIISTCFPSPSRFVCASLLLFTSSLETHLIIGVDIANAS